MKENEIVDRFINKFANEAGISSVVLSLYKNNIKKMILDQIEIYKKQEQLLPAEYVAKAVSEVGKAFKQVMDFDYKPITADQLLEFIK